MSIISTSFKRNMNAELKLAKNKIIDKILILSVFFVAIPYAITLYRIYDSGWQNMYLMHTLLYLFIIQLAIFRNRYPFVFKVTSSSLIFLYVGIVGLLFFGFVGGFYNCFLPIIISGILLGRRQAVYYLIAITILFSLIGYGYLVGSIESKAEVANYYTLPLNWINFFAGFVYIALTIIFLASDLNEYFETTIRAKIESEIKLIKSEALLKKAQHIGKIGHWFLDLEKNELEWSDEVYNIFDIDTSQFNGTYESFLAQVHPEDKETVHLAYIESLETRQPYEIVHRILLNSGEIKYVNEKCNTEFNVSGNATKSIGTVQDVTDLVLAENALKKSEERLKEAEAIAHLGHFYYNIKDNTFTLSEEAYKILEIESEANIDLKTLYGYVHEEDKKGLKNAYAKALELKQHLDYTNRIVLKNGKIKYITEKVKIEYNNSGEPILTIGAILDVTKLKLNEIKLLAYKDQLEVLVQKRTDELKCAIEELKSINDELFDKNAAINNQKEKLESTLLKLQEMQNQLIQSEKMASLGVLTAGIAHEINNPLNFINAGLNGLERYFSKNPFENHEKIAPMLNGISTGVKRATEIVKGLGLFSRNSTSPLENCEINSILDNCLLMVHNQFKQNISIEKHYQEEIALFRGSVGKLHQIFINILVNAGQAIEGEGSITITTRSKKDFIVVEIVDDGCGIPEENMNKITDPFFTTKEAGKGIGLGLSITYNLVTEHDGTLKFESELGKGTKVSVAFPVKL